MTKNKIIKCLKIIAVFGPLVFNLLSCIVSSFSYGNMISGHTGSITTADISMDYRSAVNNFVDISNELCFAPYVAILFYNAGSDIPIITTTANFLVDTLTGADLSTLLNDITPNNFCFLGTLCLICYYLFIEFIFFIPEVLIMFVRWCKNLVYSFTQKGGFDA